jgi:hypothetical protein
MSTDTKYAEVAWTVGDIMSLTEDPDNGFDPAITEEVAAEFLDRNAHHIQNRLVELGWDVIRDLMQMDGLL